MQIQISTFCGLKVQKWLNNQYFAKNKTLKQLHMKDVEFKTWRHCNKDLSFEFKGEK